MDNNQELYHYGVKGMKWGVRKKRDYVTVFQAQRNASAAANKARKESIADSRANGPKGIGSYHKANRKALNAKRKAYGESMAKDRAHNKQLRDAVKKPKDNSPEAVAARRKKALKIGAAVAGTALAAYGTYKVAKMIKEKKVQRGIEATERALRKFERENQMFNDLAREMMSGSTHGFLDMGGRRIEW